MKKFILILLFVFSVIAGCRDTDISGVYHLSAPAGSCKTDDCCKLKYVNKKATYEKERAACDVFTKLDKLKNPPKFEDQEVPSYKIEPIDNQRTPFVTLMSGIENLDIEIAEPSIAKPPELSAEIQEGRKIMIKLGDDWYSVDAILPKGSYVEIKGSWYQIK